MFIGIVNCLLKLCHFIAVTSVETVICMCSILRRQFVSPAIWTFSKWNICLATLRSWVHACVCMRAHYMWCFHSKNRTLPTAYKHISHHSHVWTVHMLWGTLKRQSGDLYTGWTIQGSIPQLNSKSVHVGFMVDEMTLGQVFLWVLFRFPVGSVHHCTMLFDLCHQCYIILIIN